MEGAVPSSPAAESTPVDDDASAEVVSASENTTEATGTEETASTITQDDITRIIVQKIKQNRSNNEKIGAILKSYGVAKVSDLPAAKYEAFVTDLSAI